MDDRQAQLVRAAELLRRWIHLQRASWSDHAWTAPPADSPVAAIPNLRAAAQSPFPNPPPLVASPDHVDLSATAAPEARWRAGLRRGGAYWSRAMFLVRERWRVAVLATCVAAGAVAMPVYWTTWTKMLRRPVGAGQHASARGRNTLRTDTPPGAPAPVPKAGSPDAAGRTGRLRVESEPAGAQVMVDGKDRGITPLELTDLMPGPHAVRLRTETGSIERAVRIVAGEASSVSEAIYSGWLHVSSPIEIEIAEGTRRLTLDDRNHVLLPPGSHELTFENRELGFTEVRRVSIRPGGTTPLTVTPPRSLLSVTANETAEVAIDGEVVGSTPLTELPTLIGTRDITLRTASGAVRRMTVTLTTEPARMDVDFTRP